MVARCTFRRTAGMPQRKEKYRKSAPMQSRTFGCVSCLCPPEWYTRDSSGIAIRNYVLCQNGTQGKQFSEVSQSSNSLAGRGYRIAAQSLNCWQQRVKIMLYV